MEALTLPNFDGGCVTDLMPALLGKTAGESLPASFTPGGARLLLVIDGLGWVQLGERRDIAPTLAAMTGGPITTVAPSTTASALTSITTGLTPSEHGIVGYRMIVDDQVLNSLRWGTETTPDARSVIPPALLQPYPPFLGEELTLVTKAEFRRSGFTEAHLRGGRMVGYRTPALLVHETARLLHEGERALYVYYDGIDKVAHEYGLGSAYDAELAFVDRLVADLLMAIPSGTSVILTADHGQVDCGRRLVPIGDDVLAHSVRLSGEGRFRWMHASPGQQTQLAEAAESVHGESAWVRTIDQMLDEHWFGKTMDDDIRARLGDVALLPFDRIAFEDPHDSGPFDLVGRHGSVTAAEMLVPCISATT
ncbi:MAG: alkaline phosphatase family protein [Acidimicrobiia bacterium]|nr:alkaline phosphatase family protein [Acidimicrobiia bacterium]